MNRLLYQVTMVMNWRNELEGHASCLGFRSVSRWYFVVDYLVLCYYTLVLHSIQCPETVQDCLPLHIFLGTLWWYRIPSAHYHAPVYVAPCWTISWSGVVLTPTNCWSSPPSRPRIFSQTGHKRTSGTRSIPPCRRWWPWPHGICILPGAVPVGAQRLRCAHPECRSVAQGSGNWWSDSPWWWWCTKFGVAWPFFWWSYFYTKHIPPLNPWRIECRQPQQWPQPPRSPPSLGRCTLAIGPSGPLGSGGAHATLYCIQFLA